MALPHCPTPPCCVSGQRRSMVLCLGNSLDLRRVWFMTGVSTSSTAHGP